MIIKDRKKILDKICIDLSYISPKDDRYYYSLCKVLKKFSETHPTLYSIYSRNKIKGMTQKDIAKEDGVSPSTISSRMGVAKTMLKEILDSTDARYGSNIDDDFDITVNYVFSTFNSEYNKEDLSVLKLSNINIKVLSKRGVDTVSKLRQAILDIGPVWSLYFGISDAKAKKAESLLNISWDNYYKSLEEYYDKILGNINYTSRKCGPTMCVLQVLLDYYKNKYRDDFDLYYKYLTGFEWDNVVDKYGRPQYTLWSRSRSFEKYLRKPEYMLMLYRGIELNEDISNYKMIHMCKTVGFDINPIRTNYANTTAIEYIPLSSYSKRMLFSLGCSTYGQTRNKILSLGKEWYRSLDQFHMYNVDEIEFMFNISK